MALTDTEIGGYKPQPTAAPLKPRKQSDEFPALTQDELKRVIEYNPDTGEFYWRVKASKNIAVGSLAGSVNAQNYWQIRLYGKVWLGHRLAWVYVFGRWPSQIDHIDRDRRNNRISNLREVSGTDNQLNRGIQANNKTGHRGIHYSDRRREYVLQLSLKGTRVHCSYHKDIEDAVLVRDRVATQIYGYNPFTEVAEEVATTE